MLAVGRFAGTVEAVEQQQLVAGVDQRVHAFAEHGRAAGEGSRDELRHGDQEVAGKRGIDDNSRS
jgi:hypothetical protein